MSTVFELLEEEWRRLRDDRAAAGQLGEVCRRAGGARTLGEVERFVRAAPAEVADRVLLALVARAIEGHALAARVLLQLLLPGTRGMARRWWALGDADERAAAAVAAVYGRIRSYPLVRRPGRVAANVLMDAERELRRAAAHAVVTPVPDPAAHASRDGRDHHGPHDELVPHPAVELAEVLREAVHDRVISPGDAELICRSRIGGERVVDIAARRGAGSPRTLWDRRQRAEHALVTAALHRRHAAV